MMLNPFAAILQQARHALIAPSHPSAAEAIGDPVLLLIPLAIAVLVVVLGYRRLQPDGAADRRGAVARSVPNVARSPSRSPRSRG